MSKFNKPFEKHIESNAFNVNPLIDAGTHVPHHVLHPRLEEWLANRPLPTDKVQWDDDLDDMQRRLRHSLATEIVERGILGEFAEQLDDIDNETLILLMQYPITIAMLSQDYFRQNGYPYGWETPDASDDETTDTNTKMPIHRQFFNWIQTQVQRFNEWLLKLRHYP